MRAEKTDPKLAGEAIGRIKELYKIERAAKAAGLASDAVQRLREEQSIPLLDKLEEWLVATRLLVLDKSPMAQAIGYALSNWTALKTYTEDGRLPMDNNAAERSLRVVAVGRKNWNFIGNEKGGKTAAVMYSLIETAKAAGIDPRIYLRDVLLRIGTETDVTTLTPHGWKERWESVVNDHRADILQRLVGQANAAD